MKRNPHRTPRAARKLSTSRTGTTAGRAVAPPRPHSHPRATLMDGRTLPIMPVAGRKPRVVLMIDKVTRVILSWHFSYDEGEPPTAAA